jgi:hypothetical protein
MHSARSACKKINLEIEIRGRELLGIKGSGR